MQDGDVVLHDILHALRSHCDISLRALKGTFQLCNLFVRGSFCSNVRVRYSDGEVSRIEFLAVTLSKLNFRYCHFRILSQCRISFHSDSKEITFVELYVFVLERHQEHTQRLPAVQQIRRTGMVSETACVELDIFLFVFVDHLERHPVRQCDVSLEGSHIFVLLEGEGQVVFLCRRNVEWLRCKVH